MRIIFLCPPATTINGGIKQIFRMAESLIAQGRDAVILEQTRLRPAWFASTAPIIGPDAPFTGDTIFVLPEDQPHILRDFAKLPQRKIVYSQNHFYGALGLGNGETYDAFGVTDILCASRTIFAHSRIRHPRTRSHLVPCGVDPVRFAPGAKQDIIAFLPRKRPIEAAYIRDQFRFHYPDLAHWQWDEIADASETDVARRLGQARIFLSLSRLEGLGLAPLEAMSAGCVVAGFAGVGGREYATDTNGVWIGDDDCDGCVTALRQAVDLATDPARLSTYATACHETLTQYSPTSFDAAVTAAWNAILE